MLSIKLIILVCYLFVFFWTLCLLVKFSATYWQRILPFYVSRVASKDTLREHQLSQKNIYTLLLLANLTIHMRYAEHWSSMPINIICYVDNVSVWVFASFKPLFLAYIFLYNIFTIFSYIPEQFVSSQLTANIM